MKSVQGTKKVQETLMNELIAERMCHNEISEFSNAAMEWGNEQEPFARLASSDATGLDYKECGMLELDDYVAFSPDGVVIDNGVVVGGIEIKCLSSKKHVEYIRGGVIPKEYWWQVATPFILSDDIEFWDFALYDSRNYYMPLKMYRMSRESINVEESRNTLNCFVSKIKSELDNLIF